ncbi:MAG: hypothetical protein OXG64_01850 [Chloroflexi bacterium]|nr:hypothetical protein [Chloroflexota bacterium]
MPASGRRARQLVAGLRRAAVQRPGIRRWPAQRVALAAVVGAACC